MNKNGKIYSQIQKIKTQVDRIAKITKKLNRITEYKTKSYLDGKIIDLD